jgi:outer membrane protein assembly factor BamB
MSTIDVGAKPGYLVKLNRHTGEELILREVTLPEDSTYHGGPRKSPVLYKNNVIIESSTRLYAYDKQHLQVQWVYHYVGSFVSVINYALKIVDGIIYFATQGTDMVAVDAETGEQKWISDEIASSAISGPVANYDNLIFASSGTLCCFDKDTGQLYFKLDNHLNPIAVNDTLYVGGYRNPYDNSTNFFKVFKIIN